ncbi:patatin [Hyphomicrobium methylovorum]|uniref:patatin-like phospholipase family protein n=1 Tax=Hyphomicrobium methylovorum TaxID=84 RepID=UPI0015E78F22|nr:patatin-like phospholipase family protein [Hyphomicrobium methylovorum]MBA2126853.1 patatin [Hyphomicrobium methylovorum]
MKPRIEATQQTTRPISHSPRIGLALGGGGARGLAHISMLEAFDELGIRPSIIAGTSIGAIYGAAYASGISGKDLRTHTRLILGQRFGIVRELFMAAQPLQQLLSVFSARNAILNPETVLDVILPKEVKSDFAECEIPLKIVASDFYDQEPKIFTEGPLRQAVAASMALPAIFQPVILDGHALIDGGLTNPLPFDLLFGECDIVVAIDVTGCPSANPKRPAPTAFEALFASAFLFERTIVREKLKAAQPDILIRAGTNTFQVLDFRKYDEIFDAAAPAKQQLKQQLTRVLSVETLAEVTHEPKPEPATAEKPKRRSLLARARARKRD